MSNRISFLSPLSPVQPDVPYDLDARANTIQYMHDGPEKRAAQEAFIRGVKERGREIMQGVRRALFNRIGRPDAVDDADPPSDVVPHFPKNRIFRFRRRPA